MKYKQLFLIDWIQILQKDMLPYTPVSAQIPLNSVRLLLSTCIHERKALNIKGNFVFSTAYNLTSKEP